MFQGGFSSKIVRLVFMDHQETQVQTLDINPLDHNAIQSFPLEPITCTSLRISFQEFNDFYGRIILYQLEVLGRET